MNNSRFAEVPGFIRTHRIRLVALSLALLAPCFWHPRIEAGDFASHVYNAWLAQLVQKGQAPGLSIAWQWNNVLVDISLAYLAGIVGLAAAQKIVVSACVLIFFWGVFALVKGVTGRQPWYLTPCIAMLAYGYSFNMGFMNYYLSLGLACFGLAILWQARGIYWLVGLIVGGIAYLAHPIGFFWLIGTLIYVRVKTKLRGWRKLALPLAAGSGLIALYWFMVAHATKYFVDWDRGPFYFYNGADQVALYGKRYFVLAGVGFLLGVFCFALDAYARRHEFPAGKPIELPFELYLVAFCATTLLPENLRSTMHGSWIGLVGSRLTTISAIFGLCVLGFVKPRKWHLAGFSSCAIIFFVFLYQDTGWLNRLETNAERLVSDLRPGTRIIVTVSAPPDSRIPYIGHTVERACIGHCFSYANYEPASRAFRVRVQEGSPVATSSTDDAEDMSSGEYDVQEEDLPLKQIYQCDETDLAKLCIQDLVPGEKNGRLGYHPPKP